MPLHQKAEQMSESIWSAGFLWGDGRDAELQFDIKTYQKAITPTVKKQMCLIKVPCGYLPFQNGNFPQQCKNKKIFFEGHFWFKSCPYSAEKP